MIFASTRPMFSLYFCNQFNSTLTKIIGDFSRFNSILTASSEYRLGLDCISRHSWQSSLVALKSLTVYSWSLKSRQDQAQGISEDYQSSLKSSLPKVKSKVFWNPSQSTVEFWKLWRGFYRLSKNYWRQVAKYRVHISDARLIKAIHAMPRRRAWSLRSSFPPIPRCRAWSPVSAPL